METRLDEVLARLGWMRSERIWPNGLRYLWTDAFGLVLLVSLYRELGESRYLDEPAADGTPLVYTRMEGCMLWHCMTLERTERLETEAPGWIKSTALPEASNFKLATSEWVLEPHGAGTMMTYKLEMEPDFFVPPIIGPWYLKRTLSQGGLRAVTRIERLARELDGRPNQPLPPLPPGRTRNR